MITGHRPKTWDNSVEPTSKGELHLIIWDIEKFYNVCPEFNHACRRLAI